MYDTIIYIQYNLIGCTEKIQIDRLVLSELYRMSRSDKLNCRKRNKFRLHVEHNVIDACVFYRFQVYSRAFIICVVKRIYEYCGHTCALALYESKVVHYKNPRKTRNWSLTPIKRRAAKKASLCLNIIIFSFRTHQFRWWRETSSTR